MFASCSDSPGHSQQFPTTLILRGRGHRLVFPTLAIFLSPTVVDLNFCVIGVGFQLQLGEHIFVLTPALGHSGPHGISMPLRPLFLSPDQCSHGSFSLPCLCALMRALLAWHSFCPLVSILCLYARMWALLAWRSFWPLVLPLWVPVRPLLRVVARLVLFYTLPFARL